MRWNLLFCAPLLLTISAASDAQTNGQVALAADAENRWVAFDLTPGNQIRFDMMVDGSRASAILDTGVSASVASRLFASRAGLKLEPSRGERADAVGGAVPLGWTRVERVTMGAFTQPNARLAIVDLSAIATGSAQPVDLLIGSDMLSCCAIDIDYENRRFRMLASGRVPFTGARASLSRLPGTGVFTSAVAVGRSRFRPLIVDTGDGAALTLSRSAWASARIRPRTVTTAIAFGLGGPVETEMAILPDVRLGTLPPAPVETRIEAKGGFSDQTRTAGRIGNGLFQRYRVLMDARAGHMILKPGADAAKPPVRSTSGLLVGYDNGRLAVLHVMRGSPAAQAGWNARDQICTVDGNPVPMPDGGSVDTGWSAGAPGRVVRFGMCDGTERRLTLRQFY
ncbi:retropepsin-like aspartic protease [Sphingomonas sp.]|uniref:retropepsin-like aspartic protease n=1 Tax=Sphingomonas sp. TaxID=28214 RepID=UPI002C1ABE93|nr:aspartyl protease family protein [Sphingomonas sp.]HTG37924.1 aspartyl protease family protein [Sphingomonas sp.]